MANPAVGRTNSFAWWNSTAVGSGTLTAPAAAGATNVSVSSVASYYLGGTINVDTGDGGDRLESRTITAIGTAPASTTLAVPAAAGDTNVKLNSVTGMAVGGKLNIGSETKTITEVGTAAVNTTLAAATIVGDAPPPPPSLQGASWIWNVAGHSTITPAGTIYVRKTFNVADPASIARAQLRINADDSHVTYVNGQQVAQSGSGQQRLADVPDRRRQVAPGGRDQRDRGRGAPTPAARGGLIGALELDGERIVTDTTWKALDGHAGDAAGGLEHGRVRRLVVAGGVLRRPVRHRAVEPEHPDARDAEPVGPQGRERRRLPGRRHDHRRHRRQPGDADDHGRRHRRRQRDRHHGQRAAARSSTRRAPRCAIRHGRAPA